MTGAAVSKRQVLQVPRKHHSLQVGPPGFVQCTICPTVHGGPRTTIRREDTKGDGKVRQKQSKMDVLGQILPLPS